MIPRRPRQRSVLVDEAQGRHPALGIVPACAQAQAAAGPIPHGILDQLGAGICICDETDHIPYLNAVCHRNIVPMFDGRPDDFVTVLIDNIRAARGIKLANSDHADVAAMVRERRRRQSGSISFTTDAVNGTWWFVTDSKLDNGWMVAIAQDFTAIKHSEFLLRDAHAHAIEEAHTDFLTGAPNRRAGLCHAQQRLAASRITGGPLSIAWLDIDHFKDVNDLHGHDVGDLALIHFVKVVMGTLGARDHFSRIGGEEFLLVSDDLTPQDMERLMLKSLKPVPPLLLDDGARLQLTLSAGLAAASPDESWEDLFRRADRALYHAKANGRNRVEQALPCRESPERWAPRLDEGDGPATY